MDVRPFICATLVRRASCFLSFPIHSHMYREMRSAVLEPPRERLYSAQPFFLSGETGGHGGIQTGKKPGMKPKYSPYSHFCPWYTILMAVAAQHIEAGWAAALTASPEVERGFPARWPPIGRGVAAMANYIKDKTRAKKGTVAGGSPNYPRPGPVLRPAPRQPRTQPYKHCP